MVPKYKIGDFLKFNNFVFKVLDFIPEVSFLVGQDLIETKFKTSKTRNYCYKLKIMSSDFDHLKNGTRIYKQYLVENQINFIKLNNKIAKILYEI